MPEPTTTIGTKDLQVKDINGRMQAICLQLPHDTVLTISPYTTTMKLFVKRSKEFTELTREMLFKVVSPGIRYNARYPSLAVLLLITCNEKNLDALYLAVSKHGKTLIGLGLEEPRIDGKMSTPKFYHPETDPNRGTFLTTKYTINKYARHDLIQFLDHDILPAYVARYPDDTNEILRSTDNVELLKRILTTDNADQLLWNQRPAVAPMQARILELATTTMEPVTSCLQHLLELGYLIRLTPPAKKEAT